MPHTGLRSVGGGRLKIGLAASSSNLPTQRSIVAGSMEGDIRLGVRIE